jgi:hypothetical protein
MTSHEILSPLALFNSSRWAAPILLSSAVLGMAGAARADIIIKPDLAFSLDTAAVPNSHSVDILGDGSGTVQFTLRYHLLTSDLEVAITGPVVRTEQLLPRLYDPGEVVTYGGTTGATIGFRSVLDFVNKRYLVFNFASTNSFLGFAALSWNSETSTLGVSELGFETTPSGPLTIPVPEPSAALLLGASGLLVLRRRRGVPL